MKKLIITALVCALTITLCAVPVSAATLSYNTSDFLAPIISKADGSIVKHPSSLHYPNGDVANFYWCGTNTQGAYTFGNVWKTHNNRTAPQGYAEQMWLNFYLASTGAYVGDFVHFDTNITFMFPDYEVLEVYLIPAFDDGVSSQRRTIFSNTNGTWTGAINWTGSFTKFYCYPDDNPTVEESRKVCDGFVLSISLRQSNYPENSTSYPYSKGLWVQFSKESIFFSGSNIEYENMLSQKENNKLLTDLNANQAETNKQLEEANDSLDNIAGNQEETNSKLDDLSDKQDDTNSKLDNLGDKQDDTNEMLGDITEDEYEKPDDSTLNDYNSAEDSLMEDTEAGSDEMTNIFDNFGTTLTKYAKGVMAVTAIFGVFAEIPEIYNLLFISLGIGLLAFLLGVGSIGLSAANAANEYARSHPYSPLMSPDGSRHRDYSADEKWLL